MNNCAWCKKEWGDTYKRTHDDERLCSEECANKYFFGYNHRMFAGKTSNLTKEQRRSVSEKFHEIMTKEQKQTELYKTIGEIVVKFLPWFIVAMILLNIVLNFLGITL